MIPRRAIPRHGSLVLLAGLACLAVCAHGAAPPPAPADGGIFTDRSAELGLAFVHFNGMSGQRFLSEIMGAGGALFDYDNDGDLDTYLVQGAMLGADQDLAGATFPPQGPLPPRDRLYRSELVERGRLFYADVTEASGIVAPGYGMGVAVGDVDNDGSCDLYVTNFGSNQMWRNDGDGTFSDITGVSGTDDARWSTSAAFLDYDRDGWLDLFVANYVDFALATHKACYGPAGGEDYCSPLSYRPEPNRLMRNRGDGTFVDASVTSGIARAYGGALGVVATDVNSDGWPDIYVANDGRANLLWTNQGDGRFVEEGLISGAAVNENGRPEGSMGVDAADYDGDGDEDLFMTHLDEETNTLYRNDGVGFFEDYTFEAGVGVPSRGFTGFGTAFLDFDNDSWLDLLIANGAVRVDEMLAMAGDPFPLRQTNQLLRNLGDGRFEEATTAAGSVFELSEVSRGAAFGDVDNDGDTDVLILNNSGPVRLLINELGSRSNWVGLRLVGAPGGRDLYGTRVACTLSDGRTLWRTVRAAASYCSSNDPRVLLGLGTASSIRRLEAYWPDGYREEWDGAAFRLRQYYTVVRGSGQAARG